MSEITVIKSEESLAQTFCDRVKAKEFPWLQADGVTATVNPLHTEFRLDFDSCTTVFAIEFRLNPGRREAELAAAHKAKRPLLLVTVRLSQAFIRHCRELGVSCADLNGHAWIRADGVLIDSASSPQVGAIQYKTEEKEPDLFSPKSSRLARALLSFPERVWKQSDIVDVTGLATGLVSRLINYLVHLGWVDGSRGNWRLAEFDALLDAWVQADTWSKRVTLRQYSTLERDLNKLARRLTEHPGHTVAFTQWFAAGLRYPYAEVPILSVYANVLPDHDELSNLDFSEVSTGGRVWMLLPRDTGVFQAGRYVHGFPLVSDVQIYLDLLQAGLRGPDRAKALREWTGFCK